MSVFPGLHDNWIISLFVRLENGHGFPNSRIKIVVDILVASGAWTKIGYAPSRVTPRSDDEERLGEAKSETAASVSGKCGPRIKDIGF